VLLMCLGIPARVVALREGSDLVEVDMVGAPHLVNAGLLEAVPQPGEWVLVHLGHALSTMTPQEAAASMATLAEFAAERAGRLPGEAPW
jgi:hydrogenase expression/formation protein HypC